MDGSLVRPVYLQKFQGRKSDIRNLEQHDKLMGLMLTEKITTFFYLLQTRS